MSYHKKWVMICNHQICETCKHADFDFGYDNIGCKRSRVEYDIVINGLSGVKYREKQAFKVYGTKDCSYESI